MSPSFVPRLVFDGLVTTRTPLHIASPDKVGMFWGRGFAPADAQTAMNKTTFVTRTPLLPPPLAADVDDRTTGGLVEGFADLELEGDMPAAAPAGLAERRRGPATGRVVVPTINATTLRGALRRACADIVLDTVAAHGEKLDLKTYHAMLAGAAQRAPGGGDVSLDGFQRAAAHPFAGLFGGGPALYPSSLVIHTAYPMVAHPALEPLIPERWRAQVTLGDGSLDAIRDLVYRHWFFRREEVLTGRDVRALEMVQDAEAIIRAVRAEIERHDARKGQTDDAGNALQEGASKDDLRTVACVEAVVPGVAFYVRFELPATATAAQRGLLLRGLQRFAERQALGGLGRHGWGRFGVRLEQEEDGMRDLVLRTEGEASAAIVQDQPSVAEALAALAAEAPTAFRRDVLDAIFKPREEA